MLSLAILTLATGLSLFSTRAWAMLTTLPENGIAGHLTLRSDPAPARFLGLSPGDTRSWQIAADLVDPSSPLTMQFTRNGALVSRPDGLQVRAQLCDSEWTDLAATPTCPTGSTNVFGPVAASDPRFGPLEPNHTGALTSPTWSLGTITDAHDEYLLVTLSIPDSPSARRDRTLMGLSADIGFGFNAEGGDTPAAPPPARSALAPTGVDVVALLLLASGALGIGATLGLASRARRRLAGGRDDDAEVGG